MNESYPLFKFDKTDEGQSFRCYTELLPEQIEDDPTFRDVVMSLIRPPLETPYYPTPSRSRGFVCILYPGDFGGTMPPDDVLKQMCILQITSAYNRVLKPNRRDLTELLSSPNKKVREYAIKHSAEWMKRIQAEEIQEEEQFAKFQHKHQEVLRAKVAEASKPKEAEWGS